MGRIGAVADDLPVQMRLDDISGPKQVECAYGHC